MNRYTVYAQYALRMRSCLPSQPSAVKIGFGRKVMDIFVFSFSDIEPFYEHIRKFVVPTVCFTW